MNENISMNMAAWVYRQVNKGGVIESYGVMKKDSY
jgi:hypothetical protein